MADSGLVTSDDGVTRCRWGNSPEIYRAYHDSEWGLPVDDDRRLFEKLCLEGFQAGLSWLTILRKRERFRRAFAEFEPEAVARFGERDVERLLGDAGIVRHRGKIEATIANAAAALRAREEHGSLSALVWSFEPPRRGRGVPKRLGFRFVGPTTAYAAMQSVGLVNDHVSGCHVRGECERERRALGDLTG